MTILNIPRINFNDICKEKGLLEEKLGLLMK